VGHFDLRVLRVWPGLRRAGRQGQSPALTPAAAPQVANAQGGLIFVGITDRDRDMVGVPREALAHVADVLATRL
jgi:hypothetical protein